MIQMRLIVFIVIFTINALSSDASLNGPILFPVLNKNFTSKETFVILNKDTIALEPKKAAKYYSIGALIDMAHGVQVTITNINEAPDRFIIQLSCLVKPESATLEICFKKTITGSEKICSSKDADVDIYSKSYLDVTFSKLAGFGGGIVKLNGRPGQLNPQDGFFYCKWKLGNSNTLLSNYIEIRNVMVMHQHISRNFKPSTEFPQAIVKESYPMNLAPIMDCLEVDQSLKSKVKNTINDHPWVKSAITSPFQWVICPAGFRPTIKECLKDDRVEFIDGNDPLKNYVNRYSLTYEGKLLIEEGVVGTNSFAVACVLKKQFVRMWYIEKMQCSGTCIKKGLMFTKSASNVTMQTVSGIPQSFHYEYRFGKSAQTHKLEAFYYCTERKEVKFTWTKDGKILNLGEQYKYGIDTDANSLTFKNEITPFHAGKYILKVSDGTNKKGLEYSFTISTKGPPMPESCSLPYVSYVKEGDNLNLKCTYIGSPTSLKLNFAYYNIDIAGMAKINAMKNVIKGEQAELVNLLDRFKVFPTEFIPSSNSLNKDNFTYSADNLKSKEDHSIGFYIQNEYGAIRTNTAVFVYPVPALSMKAAELPSAQNCDKNCFKNVSHTFKCPVPVALYARKQISVKVYWQISNINVQTDSNLKKIFEYNDSTFNLTMKPLTDKTTSDSNALAYTETILKNYKIECVVELYAVGHEQNKSSILYSSRVDSSLKSKLQIKVQFYKASTVKTANLYWIIGVVLGVVVLVIIIAVVTKKCVGDNKGETYNLDKMERQHGYDPVKELEKEAFKPYERTNEDYSGDVIKGSKVSLTGNSVGYGSNDDGELEEYDLDPANFNEEASFIGKYASDPRNSVNPHSTNSDV